MIARHAARGARVRNRILASAAPLFAMLLAILAGTVLLAPVNAEAQPHHSVSAITVDVAPLRARGVGVFADLLHDSLRAELRSHYTIAADAPRLHVTLNSFFLNANTSIDHDDSFGGGFAQPPLDNLGGEAQLIAPDGRVIDSYSLLANNPATTGSHRPPPEREQIRAMALTEVFAGWVVRRF